MDLTTAEAKVSMLSLSIETNVCTNHACAQRHFQRNFQLLQGAYQRAEDFISDISLVFANAIEFNKDGHEIGEPMSCAYYEAAAHLLKYSRWLSLEVLESCIVDCTDSPVVERGSAPKWKLTKRNANPNRNRADTSPRKHLAHGAGADDRAHTHRTRKPKMKIIF